MVTNQPDVSRGKIKKKTVIKMHNYLLSETKLDDIFVCYHDDHDDCKCRKPKPGLLLEAGKKWNIDLKNSYIIGDRLKDIEAGKYAGCKTIFIDWGYEEDINFDPDKIVKDLKSGVDWILNRL